MTRGEPQPSFSYLGILLQLLRRRRAMSRWAIERAFESRGLTTIAGAWRAVETGHFVPEDGSKVIQAFADILSLTDDEVHVLVTLWGFAVLHQELGEQLAREVLSEVNDARQPAS